MDCFRCRQPMRKGSRDGVLVDVCENCGGLWLDAGELEALERKEALDRVEMTRRARKELTEDSRRILKVVDLCPKCQVARLKQIVKRGVQLDYCPNCKGLFFDDRELERVLAAGKNETQAGFLKNVLSIIRGQKG
jgi:Zn-finger nucleic acid-binding protein